MPGRTSKRADLMQTALSAFSEAGYEGTSVAALVEMVGLSKAAFSYHFESKEQLLVELVTPLLDDLTSAVRAHPRRPDWPAGVRALLADYLEVLVRRREVVIWVDGDKSVLNHPELGPRLAALNRRVRRALTGGAWTADARLASSAALGTLWRPLRNLPNTAANHDLMLDAALGAMASMRD